MNQDISKDFLDNITVAVDLTDEDRNPLEAAADADTRMNMVRRGITQGMSLATNS